MSQQFWTNLNVGVCWLVCVSVWNVCVCVCWVCEGKEWELEHDVPRHSFPGPQPTEGVRLQLCALGTPLITKALFSVLQLTWSTPVTSLYPHPLTLTATSPCHWLPLLSLYSFHFSPLIPFLVPLCSKLDPSPFMVFGSPLMVSVQQCSCSPYRLLSFSLLIFPPSLPFICPLEA